MLTKLSYKVWWELLVDELESLWITLRTPRMPKEYSHILLVYHPTGAAQGPMINHINYAIDHIRSTHQCSGFLFWDPNKLPTHRFSPSEQLKHLQENKSH